VITVAGIYLVEKRLPMPKQVAVINYQRCEPALCEAGICQATLACPRKLLKQEAPFEMPDAYTNMCVGCAICVQACPKEAVKMI
jgi:translation initiation factor RLI1